jgi:hypothetical protein
MQPFRLTEEKSNMKLRFAALLAGFCLVVGLPLAALAGPTPGGPSSDTDGVEDAFDNCLPPAVNAVNPNQSDKDHDGCGDFCDADMDQNSTAGVSDFLLFKSAFGASSPSPAYNPSADMDCNGAVGVSDFLLFKAEFGTTAGPSGVSNKNPTACP